MLIGWCFNCNVPILDAKVCGICSSESSPLPVRRGDLKPIFSVEKKFYNKIIDKSLGISHDLLPSNLCFISNGSIIVDGQKAFRIFLKDNEWNAKAYGNFEAGDLKGSYLHEIIRANAYLLKEKEQEAVDFLKNTFEKYDMPRVVSISGGKDSSCALSLAKQVDKEITAIYMNTTLDYPETVEYLHKLNKKWKLNLVEILPERTFLDLAKELGPPSTMMPWCCQTQKFAPFNRYLNEHYPNGVLSVEGLRKYESEKRKNYERVSANRAIPKKIAVCPILNWTTLDVWLYSLWKEIPINPLYKYGSERIGCWVCPHMRMTEIKFIQRKHPELLEKWYSFLFDYASRNGKDKEWVYGGNWRFRREAYEKIPIHSRRVCSIDDSFMFEIKDDSALRRVKELMKIFGKMREVGDILLILGKNIQISIIGSNIRVSSKDKLIIKRFEKQLLKAINCVGCGACVGICKALEVKNGLLTIDEKICTHCLKCTTSKYLRMSCIALNYKKKRYVWKDTMARLN